MMSMNPHRHFSGTAIWDDEAKVYYSQSDIKGLHIEADSLAEFEAAMDATALKLIIANHISAQEKSPTSLAALMPILRWAAPVMPVLTAA
jgi:Domain of unknown function (DUF1902)